MSSSVEPSRSIVIKYRDSVASIMCDDRRNDGGGRGDCPLWPKNTSTSPLGSHSSGPCAACSTFAPACPCRSSGARGASGASAGGGGVFRPAAAARPTRPRGRLPGSERASEGSEAVDTAAGAGAGGTAPAPATGNAAAAAGTAAATPGPCRTRTRPGSDAPWPTTRAGNHSPSSSWPSRHAPPARPFSER